jgi:hypothetical protein
MRSSTPSGREPGHRLAPGGLRAARGEKAGDRAEGGRAPLVARTAAQAGMPHHAGRDDGPRDRSSWPSIHRWMGERADAFGAAFRPTIAELGASGLSEPVPSDVRPDVRRGDVRGAPAAEERGEALGALPGLAEGALAVDLVVAEEVPREVLEGDALDVAPGAPAGGDLAEAPAEEADGVGAVGAPGRLLDALAARQVVLLLHLDRTPAEQVHPCALDHGGGDDPAVGVAEPERVARALDDAGAAADAGVGALDQHSAALPIHPQHVAGADLHAVGRPRAALGFEVDREGFAEGVDGARVPGCGAGQVDREDGGAEEAGQRNGRPRAEAGQPEGGEGGSGGGEGSDAATGTGGLSAGADPRRPTYALAW